MGADSARKRTLWGSSALEMGDHRLLENGSERGDALDSDVVVSETASKGWGGDSERVSVSMGIDRKANTLRVAAPWRSEICVSLRMAASAAAPLSPILFLQRLQSMGGVGAVRDEACQWALTQRQTLESRFECHSWLTRAPAALSCP